MVLHSVVGFAAASPLRIPVNGRGQATGAAVTGKPAASLTGCLTLFARGRARERREVSPLPAPLRIPVNGRGQATGTAVSGNPTASRPGCLTLFGFNEDVYFVLFEIVVS